MNHFDISTKLINLLQRICNICKKGILRKDPNTIINMTMAYAIGDHITSRPGYNFSKVRTFDDQSSNNY